MFGIFKKKTPAPEQTIDLSDPELERRRKAFRATMQAADMPTFRERYLAKVEQKAQVDPYEVLEANHQARMEKVRRQLTTQMANLSRVNTAAGVTINPCSEIPLGSTVILDPKKSLAAQIVGDPASISNAFINTSQVIQSGSISASQIQAGSISNTSGGPWVSSDHAVDAAKYQFFNTTNPDTGETEMAKQPLSNEARERMMDVGRRIIELAKDTVFEVEGIPTLTVKQQDGQYRKKAMSPGWGFTLIDVYVGSRETLIFVLEPIDSLPFEVIECSIKEADSTFLKLGAVLAEAAEITGTATLGGVYGILEHNMKKEAEQAQLADAQAVVSNPNWGRF
jgi:hypothetical protein